MAENQSYAEQNKARLKDITDSIETGIKELFESDKYKQYLSTMSRFHKYSVNNTMLIYMQRPDATHVAGFNKWHDQFGRNVMKGEKGIKIIAPTPYKKKIEKDKIDPDTKLPMLDADGNVMKEEREISIPMFKPVTVFDVSQTEGKPLPQLASDLHGNVQNYDVFMEALRRSAPVPLVIEPMAANMDGFFSLDDQRIAVREGMSEVQTVCAAVHEIAHSKLHNKDEIGEKYQGIELFGKPSLFSNGRVDRDKLPEGLYCYDLRGSDYDPGMPVTIQENVVVNHAASVITAEPVELPEEGFLYLGEDGLNFTGDQQTVKEFYHAAFPEKAKLSRATEEIQAESISYAVCAYYGIETGENSFGYLATWAKGKDLTELRASLETINRTSSELITDIDRNYAEICKERGITQEKEAVEQEPATAQERLYTVDDKYLHVQRSDEGFDYTLYDKASKKEIDGGQLDSDFPLIMDAAQEICKLHELGNDAPLQLADIGILDELQSSEVKAWEDDHVTDIESTTVPSETPAAPEEMLPDSPEQNRDEPMPDPEINERAMQSYGYTDEEMLPLSKDRALELMERDVTVYLLYGDNTEAMALDDREIIEHNGLFGISREDWDAIKADIPPRDVEKRFEQNPEDGILIYQLKDTAPRELFFAGSDELKDAPNADNYKAVYTQPLYDGGSKGEVLEQAYAQFNIYRPADFTGHSLSVSDIVAIKRGPDVSYHYCDTFGFKELEKFKADNYLKAAEMSMEDDYGMIDGIINNGPKKSTAEIEADAMSGKPVSLRDYVEAVRREQETQKEEPKQQKKPSVLAKLHAPVSEPKKTARSKSAEREL